MIFLLPEDGRSASAVETRRPRPGGGARLRILQRRGRQTLASRGTYAARPAARDARYGRPQASTAGIGNFTTHTTNANRLPFKDASFDVVFMVTVLGEIADQDAFLSEAFRVLKRGGVLSITEHHPDPDFEPEPVVRQRLKQHGFTPDNARKGWRWAYTLNASRHSESEGVVADSPDAIATAR